MDIILRYMFVPSNNENTVIQNAIASYKRSTTKVETIRAKHGKDACVILCKQNYYVVPDDTFRELYDILHRFKLGN